MSTNWNESESIAADPGEDWQQRLTLILDTMREMSSHTDPETMVRAYGERIQELFPFDRRISLSRRGLQAPEFRITRSTTWTTSINPWLEKDRLPRLKGGLLADLIYANEARLFDDLEVSPDDPAYEYLAGQRSVVAIPMFDSGESLNMVLLMRSEPGAFSREQLPDLVWRSNLFGRATSSLVLSEELRRTYNALDRELKLVGDIQRSLLPPKLPKVEGFDIAAFYQPSQRAGGDYYDFFPLPDGKLGILLCDVSGHGTPAAVIMAVAHCIVHMFPGDKSDPIALLNFLNEHLVARYTNQGEGFVTAFYGVYDSTRKSMRYSSAGHPPPLLKRCSDGSLLALNQAGGLPLGIMTGAVDEAAQQEFHVGDQLVFYTDGITEAANESGELYGTDRLWGVLSNCSIRAGELLRSLLTDVQTFTNGPAQDDQTVVVARITK